MDAGFEAKNSVSSAEGPAFKFRHQHSSNALAPKLLAYEESFHFGVGALVDVSHAANQSVEVLSTEEKVSWRIQVIGIHKVVAFLGVERLQQQRGGLNEVSHLRRAAHCKIFSLR
jgi:hypothetical protein